MQEMCENHGSKVLRPFLRTDEVGAGTGFHFIRLSDKVNGRAAGACGHLQSATGEDTAGSS